MNNAEPKREARSPRPRDEAPFCWCSRAALERIEKSAEITNQARTKLVYAAGHVVEASRQGEATYRAPKDLIARNARVSSRTVTAANAELAAAGLIIIDKHFDAQRKQYDVRTRCKPDDTPIAIGLSSGLHRSDIRFTSEDAGAIRRGQCPGLVGGWP
jgi:hypothetical protein